jgi:hypothetical protein
MASYFDLLSDDQIIEIALTLDRSDIDTYCSINKRFNLIICNNNYFWREKCLRDYGKIFTQDNTVDWQRIYKGYGKIFILANGRFGPFYINYGDKTVCHLVMCETRSKCISTSENHTYIVDMDNEIMTMSVTGQELPNIPQMSKVIIPSPTHETLKGKYVSSSGVYTSIIDLNDDLWIIQHTDDADMMLDLMIGEPVQIPNLKAKSASCGFVHIVVTNFDDEVLVAGINHDGQLGLGNNIDSDKFVPLGIKAKSIKCGEFSTILIDINDDVWIAGHITAEFTTNILTKIPNIKGKSIHAGRDAGFAIIDFDNSVYINTVKVENVKASQVMFGREEIFIIDVDANIWKVVMGHPYGNPRYNIRDYMDYATLIPDIKAHSISCGSDYSTILTLY